MTNATSLVLPVAFIAIMNVYIITHPTARVVVLGLIFCFLYCWIPFFNKKGYVNLSRYLANILLAGGILTLTIVRKKDVVTYESWYFVSRASLLVFSIAIPFTLYQMSETRHLLITSFMWLACLLLYDPMHNLFGVGFYQTGHDLEGYYNYNIFFFIIYVTAAFIMGYLKKHMEDYEQKYEKSLRLLDEKAATIQRQKEKLLDKNWLLTDMLNKQDQHLIETNQELTRKNNDLVQFSLAVSHNLRSPVASILGLINLLKKQGSSNAKEKEIVLDHLTRSAHHLDSVTHDLNRIMDNRNDALGPLEDVDLQEELLLIETSLSPLIAKSEVTLRYDLHVKTVFTARSYLYNILSQLIANGIQFRAEDREPFVKISSRVYDKKVQIEVEDNGVGINLAQHKDDLFKPFKQFHPTLSGRGTGLYLVKLQVEKLNGTISMKSTPNVGSRVTIAL